MNRWPWLQFEVNACNSNAIWGMSALEKGLTGASGVQHGRSSASLAVVALGGVVAHRSGGVWIWRDGGAAVMARRLWRRAREAWERGEALQQ